MTSISQRALGVKDMPEREQPISELFRIAADAWADADGYASYFEEMKTTTLEQMKSKLIAEKGDMADNKAERLVKSGEDWPRYIKAMVDARTQANKLKNVMEQLRFKEREVDRSSWSQRMERHMGRSAT